MIKNNKKDFDMAIMGVDGALYSIDKEKIFEIKQLFDKDEQQEIQKKGWKNIISTDFFEEYANGKIDTIPEESKPTNEGKAARVFFYKNLFAAFFCYLVNKEKTDLFYSYQTLFKILKKTKRKTGNRF